jgi:hypothetical protein
LHGWPPQLAPAAPPLELEELDPELDPDADADPELEPGPELEPELDPAPDPLPPSAPCAWSALIVTAPPSPAVAPTGVSLPGLVSTDWPLESPPEDMHAVPAKPATARARTFNEI